VPLPWRERIALALLLLRLGVAIALLPFAIDWRSPLLASLRPAALPALIALPLLLIAMDGWTLWTAPHNRIRRALSIGVIVAAGASLLATVSLEGSFRWVRARVLAADMAQLEKLGRHFIVGYRDPAAAYSSAPAMGSRPMPFAARSNNGRTSADAKACRCFGSQPTRRAARSRGCRRRCRASHRSPR
jgi:hypothetical protein